MDRLNPLDALFVDAEDEDRHTSMAIASIAVFEGPPPSQDEILTSLAGRLPLVPRYRQKLRTVPFRLGWPVWVDDPNFDLSYHVRRTALPAPGEDRQLSQLIGRVMGQRLDRDYPLWEYCDNVTFGITGDFAANADLDVLAHGIEQDLSALLEAATDHSRLRARLPRPRRSE